MTLPVGAWVTFIVSIIVVVVGGFRVRALSFELKLLLLFLGIVVINNIILIYWAYLKINNIWLFHFYTLLEYSFLAYILSSWQKTPMFRYGIRWSIGAFAIFWIIAKFTFEPVVSYDAFTATISRFLLIGFASLSLYELSKSTREKFYLESRFWISGAILIYSAGSILWLALSNVINSWPESQMMAAWTIHWILDILTNILYLGGFLCPYRK